MRARQLAEEISGDKEKRGSEELRTERLEESAERIIIDPVSGKRFKAISASSHPSLAASDYVRSAPRPLPYEGTKPPSQLNQRLRTRL